MKDWEGRRKYPLLQAVHCHGVREPCHKTTWSWKSRVTSDADLYLVGFFFFFFLSSDLETLRMAYLYRIKELIHFGMN